MVAAELTLKVRPLSWLGFFFHLSFDMNDPELVESWAGEVLRGAARVWDRLGEVGKRGVAPIGGVMGDL